MRQETERPAAGTRARRSPFDHFVEATYQHVSGPPFFLVCLAIVVGWLVSLPLWGDPKAWQVAIHTVASVLTLLLVALLENAGRRSAEAAQEKLNVIAEALAALMASRAPRGRNARESSDPFARRGRPRRAPLNQPSRATAPEIPRQRAVSRR